MLLWVTVFYHSHRQQPSNIKSSWIAVAAKGPGNNAQLNFQSFSPSSRLITPYNFFTKMPLNVNSLVHE